MEMERDDQIARNKAIYCRYLACCNMHAFERLGESVSESVKVNGKPCGLADYTRGLLSVVEAFPDYQWALEHLIGEGDWLAAQFRDHGTHRGVWLGIPPTGKAVTTVELALYRLQDNRIAEAWVTADNVGAMQQLLGAKGSVSGK